MMPTSEPAVGDLIEGRQRSQNILERGGYQAKMNYRVTSYKFGSKISSRLQVTSYNSYKIQSYIFIIES